MKDGGATYVDEDTSIRIIEIWELFTLRLLEEFREAGDDVKKPHKHHMNSPEWILQDQSVLHVALPSIMPHWIGHPPIEISRRHRWCD